MTAISEEPYHEGEKRIQELTGERETARANARNIASRIPAAARGFVAQQYYCLLGWVDAAGQIWAAFLAGPKGFAQTDSAGAQLELTLHDPNSILASVPPVGDSAAGDHIGVLFVELASRRRLRVNGRITATDEAGLVIAVEHAYPLCPKYIQRRHLVPDDPPQPETGVAAGRELTASLTAWIAEADTFFVASAHPEGQADVAHRGGRAGFIRVENNSLTIPDYSGNSMFNTFGNFVLNPRAGLAFVDFANNRQLLLTGTVTLDLQASDTDGATGGTGRWWHFHTEHWRVVSLNRAFAWEFVDESPFNP